MSKRQPAGPAPESSATQAPGVEDVGSEFLDQAEIYRRYVQEGLDDISAGRTRPWAEVKAELRAKFGIPKA